MGLDDSNIENDLESNSPRIKNRYLQPHPLNNKNVNGSSTNTSEKIIKITKTEYWFYKSSAKKD